MSKQPWGKIGNWAAEAERAEAEERELAASAVPVETFPSLSAAASTKQKKKTKMSLQEFTLQTSSSGARGLTTDELLRLPRGPKERSPDEMYAPRGFSNYGAGGRDGGGGGGGGGRRSYGSGGGGAGGGGFEHDDRRAPGPPRVSEFDMPSRADEADNWAMGKKNLPSFESGGGRSNNRYSSLGGGGGGGSIGSGGGGSVSSRADEVDNWGTGKKPLVAPSRSSTFGSSYRDSGPEPNRWARGVARDDEPRERPRLVLDPRKKEGPVVVEPVVKTNKPSPFGAARPREEVLAEKGLDWKKIDSEIEAKKTSRPTSSHSNSRPTSSQSNRSDGVAPRPKVNPFGDAKPREVLLQEKGLDYKKIDLELEHRRVDRPETEVEKHLKEEIENLKKMELAKESAPNATSEPSTKELRDIILAKERDLELLIRELDDKVRFGPRINERPGSGAGRPHSRSGSIDESRSMEFMERPRSRGTGDFGARPPDDRRAFQGGMERAFMGNRGMDRPRSRERW